MSDELSTAACAFALLCAGAYAKLYVIKDAQHNSSLRGRDYYKEVMTTQNAARFFEVCRMSYASFLKFVNLLVDHGGLEGSRNIHTGEMTMMFMNSLTGASLAKQAERWQHSKSTCSECNAKVRKAILNCKKMLYVKASEHDEVHSKFFERKFAPFCRHGYSFLEFNCWSEQDEYYIPEEDECDAPGDDVEQHESAAVNKGLLNKWRDDIADELWAAYMDELKIRGIPHNSLA